MSQLKSGLKEIKGFLKLDPEKTALIAMHTITSRRKK